MTNSKCLTICDNAVDKSTPALTDVFEPDDSFADYTLSRIAAIQLNNSQR